MTEKDSNSPNPEIFNRENYDITTLDDEITADKNCQQLLKQYHYYLLKNKGFTPLESGSMASGTDYFLRDYMIDKCRTNIFAISPELVGSFAGNWYIVSTLEPNMDELQVMLAGIGGFYSFCATNGAIDPKIAATVNQACAKHEFYRQRIESFHAITADGFTTWNKIC